MDEEESGPPEPPEAPEWARALHWLHHHFTVNRELLIKPPVLLALALFAFSGYWYGLGKSSERLGIAQDRNSFLNDQINAYKDRLQGATPDQAAKKIAELDTAVATLSQKLSYLAPDSIRALSQQQKNFISEHKEDFKRIAHPLAVFTRLEGDSVNYTHDFTDAFNASGIPISGPYLSFCLSNQHGALVGYEDRDKPPPDATTLIKLLTDMGLHPQVTIWREHLDQATGGFDLFIC